MLADWDKYGHDIADLRVSAWKDELGSNYVCSELVDEFDAASMHAIIEIEGVLVGAVRANIYGYNDRTPYPLRFAPLERFRDARFGLMSRLVVRPTYSGRGIASALLTEIIQIQLSKTAAVCLGFTTNSIIGNSLLRRGFVQIGTASGFPLPPPERSNAYMKAF